MRGENFRLAVELIEVLIEPLGVPKLAVLLIFRYGDDPLFFLKLLHSGNEGSEEDFVIF